jgi:aldoxime dehydratase
MEPAIAENLRVERTLPPRVGAEFHPPYPSYVARFKPSVMRLAMAYFGVQDSGDATEAARANAWIAEAFAKPNGPSHWDRAEYVDEKACPTSISAAYWDDVPAFDAWLRSVRSGWTGGAWAKVGVFIEALRPSLRGFETLFSSLGRVEGAAVLSESMSGEIPEHAYWGGMRDRIPLSQVDAMTPAGSPGVAHAGACITVIPHDNLCLIRSGQDWGDTDDVERKMYLTDIEPVLRQGMEYLRDDGLPIGCFANRYVRVLDAAGQPTEKSYGVSWWRGLSELERWAESHPTHLEIFGAAMKYLRQLGPAAKLRLYHEVTVARSDEQFFEYRNCHAKTGMLRAAGE